MRPSSPANHLIEPHRFFAISPPNLCQESSTPRARTQRNTSDNKTSMVSSSLPRYLVPRMLLLLLPALHVSGFQIPGGRPQIQARAQASLLGTFTKVSHHVVPNRLYARIAQLQLQRNDAAPDDDTSSLQRGPEASNNILACLALVTALAFTPVINTSPAFAYDDYASDTVQKAIQSLNEAAGNTDKTFDAFENIAEIIAEGKGIGGSVDYKGVTLNRGSISDEDTSIYNPGLTLLTEGEKERLVESLMQSRQAGVDQNQWNDKNQRAYSQLKYQLDPLHMTELRGYLKVAPFLIGIFYVGVLAVQQFARDLFPVAYIGAVLILLAPAAVLVWTAQ
jgi:hypothetical protein